MSWEIIRDQKSIMEKSNITYKDGNFYVNNYQINLENIYTKQWSNQLQIDIFVDIEKAANKLAMEQGYEDFEDARRNKAVIWFEPGSLYHIADFKTTIGSYILNKSQVDDINCIVNSEEYLQRKNEVQRNNEDELEI